MKSPWEPELLHILPQQFFRQMCVQLQKQNHVFLIMNKFCPALFRPNRFFIVTQFNNNIFSKDMFRHLRSTYMYPFTVIWLWDDIQERIFELNFRVGGCTALVRDEDITRTDGAITQRRSKLTINKNYYYYSYLLLRLYDLIFTTKKSR